MLSEPDWFVGCDFNLKGVITLLDTNRNLVVVQDQYGAVALHCQVPEQSLRVGQLVSVEGTNAVPYVPSFPEFPHWPSSNAVLEQFEAPANLGEYYLARMRGYLQPPATGEYTFWIASDNSSELWLSTDHDPRNKRRIAFIQRYNWVAPREWSRLPSQRAGPIFLKAGERYYIEAVHEQTTLADHLAVAWAGPSLQQTIIDSRYLTPWVSVGGKAHLASANGILWEYWTNFTAGNLEIISGPLTFESALSVADARLKVLGLGQMPEPKKLSLGQRLAQEDNYRWVEVEGYITFAGMDDVAAYLELSDVQGKARVLVPHGTLQLIRTIRYPTVRVRGVCEGAYDESRALVPGLIWATASDSIAPAECGEAGMPTVTNGPAATTPTPTSRTLSGFYGTRGVVTFNDRVFGKDYLFIQEGAAVVLVALESKGIKNDFKVGQWLDAAGVLERDRYVPVLRPLVLRAVGWHSLPKPITQPVQALSPEETDGRWAEFEGVAQRVNTNGTLLLVGKSGSMKIWIGQTESSHLAQYIDAGLRVRGVLSHTMLDSPLLLVPSRAYVHVKVDPPADPFQIPLSFVANVINKVRFDPLFHRVRLIGEVTWADAQSFFIQDASGGIRVWPVERPTVHVGDRVEVIGFPTGSGPAVIIAEALVRSCSTAEPVKPQKLDFSDPLALDRAGTLVYAFANLIGEKTNETARVLQLQEQQYVFEATLPFDKGNLPVIKPGSRLRIEGVCDYGTTRLVPTSGTGTDRSAPSASVLNILLRSPADVKVVKGPPWWTRGRIIALMGLSLGAVVVVLTWARLLHLRLERHQAARLAFARQFLQGQEAERQRIAANLHDSLGQSLIVIKNQVRLALQSAPDDAALRQRLNEISEVASQAVEEVRQIINNLRPYQLDRLGLTQAIRAIVNGASEHSSVVFASHVDDVDAIFDKDSEIHIYRIVQEAVNNILKHSKATEATVVVKAERDYVTLSIRDNGQGFDPSALDTGGPTGPGHGLSGIAERVRILGGKWALDTCPGQGTRITVEIPRPAPRS